MSYLQAIVIALVQGVTELFPVSSLGHSVLVPAWIGGSWQTLVTQSSQATARRRSTSRTSWRCTVATALALLWFFRADWCGSSAASSAASRRRSPRGGSSPATPDERLAWLIVIATIPVGITGLALEHVFRTVFAKPLAASVFLFVNGLILLAGDRVRRSAPRGRRGAGAAGPDVARARQRRAHRGGCRGGARVGSAHRAASLGDGIVVGLLQILALFAGISRSGVTMVGGLVRGLGDEDAARFAFLLAHPVILAAGVLKLPTLAGSAGDPSTARSPSAS